MDFLEWNNCIAEFFFHPGQANRPVFLYVTEQLLDRLRGIPQAWREFKAVVKAGHPWRPPGLSGACRKAVHCLETWRGQGLPYPGYIAYLAFFVLAATREGDFPSHAYYPRLWELLGEATDQGMPPHFDEMWRLWEDLEHWACIVRGGELGLFEVRAAGKRAHVDLPIAQTLLTEHEREIFPVIFAAATLDPLAPPAAPELARLVVRHGRQLLRPRTIRLLEQPQKDERDLAAVLLEMIGESLVAWDGSVAETAPARAEPTGRRVSGGIRLWIKLDRPAKRAQAGLRCSMPREFPEYGLRLRQSGGLEVWSCREAAPSVSSLLEDPKTGRPMDIQALDWRPGLRFCEEFLGWHFHWPASSVHILVPGNSFRLGGYIEVRQLPRSSPVLLALHVEYRDRVEAWGKASCQDFRPLGIQRGLPVGWSLYECGEVQDDSGIRDDLPQLAFPTTVRLSLRGGVEAVRSNSFFRFAPPQVCAEGLESGELVECAGQVLSVAQGVASLPEGLPAGQPTPLLVRRGQTPLKRWSFELVDDVPWPPPAPSQRFDPFGDALAAEAHEGASGARVIGVVIPPRPFMAHPFFFQRRRVFFVGAVPGQIVTWPIQPLPRDWAPVWAIPLGRSGHALFCGTKPEDSQPSRELPSASQFRKAVRRWKEVLFHRRKRIAPPQQVQLRQLWKSYQEVARHV